MEKSIIAGASYKNQKYFLEPSYAELPDAIKNELKEICILLAEKIRGLFLVNFLQDGTLSFEASSEDDLDYDEIGAYLEIEELKRDRKEFIRSLSMWYVIFRTDEGKKFISTITMSKA